LFLEIQAGLLSAGKTKTMIATFQAALRMAGKKVTYI
jgi:hypothetical protein